MAIGFVWKSWCSRLNKSCNMSEILQFENSHSDYIKANVSNSHNNNVAFEMKFSKDLTIAQLKVNI